MLPYVTLAQKITIMVPFLDGYFWMVVQFALSTVCRMVSGPISVGYPLVDVYIAKITIFHG